MKVFLRADGMLHGDRGGPKPVLDLLQDALEAGSRAVHLVDEADARYFVLVGLPPHRFRLGLHPRSGAEHHHRAVKNAQRALHLNGEVHVPGGVDDIDAMFVELLIHPGPKAGRGRRSNRNTPLLLLLHPVHDRRAFMHLTNLVGDTCVEQYALRGRGFSGIDVRHNTNVAIAFDGCFSRHGVRLIRQRPDKPGA